MGADRLNLNIPELYRMYQDGWSLRALGRLLGIDSQTVSARFRRHNLPIERFHRKVSLETLAQHHRRGMSQSEMARKFGVSYQSIFRAMERLRALAPQYAPRKRHSSRWHGTGCPWPPVACLKHIALAPMKGCAAGLPTPRI